MPRPAGLLRPPAMVRGAAGRGFNGEMKDRQPTREGPVREIAALGARVAELEREDQERIRAGAALRKSEERYRALFESSKDGIVFTDMEGRVLEANQAYLDMLGYSRAEVRQLTYQQLTPARWHEKDAAVIADQVLTRGYSDDYEKENVRKDGTVVPTTVRVCVASDEEGNPVGTWRIVGDMTEHKRADERIATQTAVLQAINDMFREALTCETEEQLGKICLGVAEQLTGSKFGFVGELNAVGLMDTLAISNPGWDARRVPGSEATKMIKNMPLRGVDRCTLREGKSRIVNDPASHAGRVGVPEGHPTVACFLGVPLKDAGKAIGMIGLANKEGGYEPADREAVEALSVAFVQALRRKRAELQIRRLNEDLQRRGAELEAANKELEAFSYSVSHDLRAPLRSIDGFSQAVLEDSGPALDASGKGYLLRMRGAAQHMGALIDDLLTLSHVGRSEMRVRRVDLSALAERVAAELRETTPQRAVEFVIQPGLTAMGDQGLLKLALGNLLGNAWKFTSRHATARIEFGSAQADGQQAYYVRDDGAGFDMAYADRLFMPFQRLHTGDEFPGTGIGLATAKRIIHRHGGRAWAQGAVENGATFYFTLQPQEGGAT